LQQFIAHVIDTGDKFRCYRLSLSPVSLIPAIN
jgi:hypothetical protein